MRAVVLEQYGGPEVLELKEIPDPVVGPEEVLVDIAATALNRADLLQRMGRYPSPPAAHEVPGLEFAGRVAAVGDRAARWSIGDAVMGIVGAGGYAERVAVHERQVMAVPSTLSLAEAGTVPEVFITAFDALVAQCGLTSGRRALVHAGASGVGTAAIQIAKAIGARIAVTCSTSKMATCEDLGADLVVDYTADDYVARCAEWAGGSGVDVILDVVGGDYFDRNLDALTTGGTLIQVGVMGEAKVSINLAKLLPKRATVIGTVLRARPLEEKIAITQRFSAEMLPLFDAGLLRPVIDSRYALDDVADAHRHMAANANVGKIALDVAITA